MGLQFSSSQHRPESLQHLNHEISRSSRSFRCCRSRSRSRGRSLVLLYPWSCSSVPSIHLRIRIPILPICRPCSKGRRSQETSCLHPPIRLWWKFLPIRLQLCPSCPHRSKTIHLLRQQWWSCPCC